MLDVRKDFNLGNEIYLDTAATSKTPKQVVNAMVDYYQNYRASVHRGVYKQAQKATQAYELSRQKIAQFINTDPNELVFTRGATESINLVAQTWGRQNIGKGDTIVLTIMEHHSNILSWQQLCAEVGCKIEYVGLTKDYRLNPEDLYKKSANAKCISLTHISNVLGTINPISQIIRELRSSSPELIVVVDGAQAVGHIPVDVKDLDCDFYAFSGHKMYGPTGIGALWGRKELLDAMPPYQTGGEMVKSVSMEHITYNEIPWKFEAGTPNIAGAIGLGAAVDYLNSIQHQEFPTHTGRDPDIEIVGTSVKDYALKKLLPVPGLRLFGPQDSKDRIGIFSFIIEGKDPVKLAEYLDQKNISIRSGNMCAQPLLKYLGVEALDRVSLGVYNNKQDIDRFIEAIGGPI